MGGSTTQAHYDVCQIKMNEPGHSRTNRTMHRVGEMRLPLILLHCCVGGLARLHKCNARGGKFGRGKGLVGCSPSPIAAQPAATLASSLSATGVPTTARYRFSVTLLPVASLPPGQAGPDHATTANGHFSSRRDGRGLSSSPIYASSATRRPS